MSESTNIFDLPTDPVDRGNITLTATENTGQNPGSISLDQSTIHQIVNSLQQASINGATQLPSRDIPMNTTAHSHDPEVRPNYVPPPPPQNIDYIQNYEQTSDMVNAYPKSYSLDHMYNEIQTPLLIAVLYFLFQLPFFRKFLFQYFPVLFSVDGNLNIHGFLFTSILFGLLFYFFNKVSQYFNAF